jgi:hypothetical protein
MASLTKLTEINAVLPLLIHLTMDGRITLPPPDPRALRAICGSLSRSEVR